LPMLVLTRQAGESIIIIELPTAERIKLKVV
jgi:sRNA-binding carbon storage regulator CsrA